MGRGLFCLIAAGAAASAWSLYSHFAGNGEERPPPSRPQSSPSRRRDAQQTTSSRVNHPPVGTFDQSRSSPTGRWQANDPPVNTFHPRPPSPAPFDDWEIIDSSRAEHSPVKTYASLSPPRSPPHIPSRRRSDWQANTTAANTYRPPSPSHRRDALQTASSLVNHPPVETSTSFGQPPHTPGRRRDDLQANDPQVGTSTSLGQPPNISGRRRDDRLVNNTPVKTYHSQSSSPALKSTVDSHVDYSQAGFPPAKAPASITHPRSPSPHIPTGLDDWEDIDPLVRTYHPPCTHNSRIDDRGTIDSSQAGFSPAKAPASISHPRSPSPPVAGHRRNNQAHDPPVETYTAPTLIYTVDGWKTLESSQVEAPLVKAHASLSHPRSPSPRIPSRQRDDQQTPDSESEGESPPLETSASLRAMAKQEGDLRSKCYQKSKKAHERRLHALAQAYSTQAKDHACKMKTLNAQASAMVFKENNKGRPAGEIDLHGLYVEEAISYVNTALKEARQRSDSEMCLIVGKGNHSDGGIARLKPAIRSAMEKRKVHVHEDPNNPGRLRLVIQR